MLAANSDRFAPGDSLGLTTQSTADLPVKAPRADQYIVPALVLLAIAFLLDRMARR